MRCFACGSESLPGMSYCGRCGAPLAPAPLTAAEAAPAKAELRQLTVLSCAPTGVADLDDPDQLRRAVADFQAAAEEIIERFDGHLVDNQGGGLVVYFGYPKAHGDDARRAIYAGLELVTVTETRARWQVDGRRLMVRAGVSTGSVVTGPVATGERRPPALGSVPHEAACLMRLAEPGDLLLSGDTQRLARGTFTFKVLGTKTFEDLTHPLEVYNALGPVTSGLFGPPATDMSGPLVGRRQELKLLRQRFAEAREGHGQIVLVAGEPGIGKTHLVRAFLDRLAEAGSPGIACWCSAYGTNTPLGPFARLLRRLAVPEAAGSGTPTTAGLAALTNRAGLPADEVVPLFAELLSLPLTEPYLPLELSPEAQRLQTLEALLNLLLGLAEERPLTFVAEDLHWADPSTLELLDLLVARGRDAPLLAIFTFRPDFEPAWAWRSRMTHLPLNRLSRRETAELIAAAGGAELPPAVRNEIARRADGVPLFIEEITKTTVGTAAASGSRPAGSAKPHDIPATLEESLRARLDRLGSAKAVAQRAAALGSSFSLELVAAVSPGGEAALALQLDRLVAAGLLHRSGFGWRSRYQFRHVLLQEMAYRSLLENDRRRLHEDVVEALDEQFPEVVERQPELAAYHATQAGLTTRAIELWQRAGRLASERSAGAEAIAHFRQALELVARQPPGGERDSTELSLRTDLGPALIAARGYASPEVEESYRRAVDLCQRVNDAELRLRVILGFVAFQFSRAEFRRSLESLHSLRELETSGLLPGVEAHFRQGAGAIATFTGDFAAAHEHQELGADLSRSHVAPFALGHDCRTAILSTHALTLWHLGYPDQALERHDEAMAWAKQIGHPFSALFAFHMGMWLRQLRSEPEIVMRQARQLRTRAAELESPYLKAEGDVFLGWASAQLKSSVTGRFDARAAGEAIRRLRRGIAEHEPLGMRMGATYRLSLLADACLRPGLLDDAAAALTESRIAADSTGEGFRSAELHRLRGEMLLAKSGKDASRNAEEAFRAALATARGQQAKSLELRTAVSLGRLWHTLDRSGEARELVSQVYGWFTEGADLPDLLAARELLDELS